MVFGPLVFPHNLCLLLRREVIRNAECPTDPLGRLALDYIRDLFAPKL